MLLDKNQLSRAEVIRRSMLDRTYAYQITGGTRLPGRDKSRDAVLIYCIEHHYDVLYTNEMLEDAEEELLL